MFDRDSSRNKSDMRTMGGSMKHIAQSFEFKFDDEPFALVGERERQKTATIEMPDETPDMFGETNNERAERV
jgi:hypothetical protein